MLRRLGLYLKGLFLGSVSKEDSFDDVIPLAPELEHSNMRSIVRQYVAFHKGIHEIAVYDDMPLGQEAQSIVANLVFQTGMVIVASSDTTVGELIAQLSEKD